MESFLGFLLFVREPRRVTVTPAGEVFVAEARLALQHLDRAINLSRSSSEHASLTIHAGKSPYTDPYLITKLLSLRLPLFPQLQIRSTSKLSGDLMRDLLDGTLDLAFLTGMTDTPQLSGTLVGDQSFWVAMSEDDPLAGKRDILPQDLQKRSCILFERHVNPNLYDHFVSIVRPASSPSCTTHHVMTAEDSLQLILRGSGVAVLSQASAWRILRAGVTMRPLNSDSLRLQTRLVARADNIVSDVLRSLVRSLSCLPNAQFHLPLPG